MKRPKKYSANTYIASADLLRKEKYRPSLPQEFSQLPCMDVLQIISGGYLLKMNLATKASSR